MQMNASSIVNQKAEWEKLGVKLPAFDHAAMTAATKEHPIWVHFGAGNIFRGFIAALQQRLLNEGLADRGIIAADWFCGYRRCRRGGSCSRRSCGCGGWFIVNRNTRSNCIITN